MKKFTVVFLSALMALSLAACGSNEQNSVSSEPQSTASAAERHREQ